MVKGTMGEFNKRRAEGGANKRGPSLKIQKQQTNLAINANTVSYIQVLGNAMDTQDASPSILLFFDKQRFIFNAGEGLQRYCQEHKIKLSKIDHIFHTRVCSQTVGGLPGLLLTLAGMREEGMFVKIWGPSDLKYLMDAMMSFIPNDVVRPNYFAPKSMENFSHPIDLIYDEVVQISAILIRRSPTTVSLDKKYPAESVLSPVDRCPPLGPLLVPHSKNPKRDGGLMLNLGDISVIYVCELPETKGKFDMIAALDLGLTDKRKRGELLRGNSVKSDKTDKLISPKQVLGDSSPGPIVLIVDCPTLSHLLELVSIQSLEAYYSDYVVEQLDDVLSLNHVPFRKKVVNCIVHLTPSSVTMTDSYQKWMSRFVGAQHIMAGYDIKNMKIPILRASARMSARLNYLCPQFFPASGFQSAQHLNKFVPVSNASDEGSVPKHSDSILAENLLKFHLRPCKKLGLDRSEVPSLLSHYEIVDELISDIPEIIDCSEQVQQLWDVEFRYTKRAMREELMDLIAPPPKLNLALHNISKSGGGDAPGPEKVAIINEMKHESTLPICLENIARDDMEIVLLGTGASQPSKYRNVSSIYVNLFSKGGILLDSGEATLAQLVKRYGQSGANDAVKRLRCIWISHIHADHHSGLFDILLRRCKLLDETPHEPLLVIGPRQLKICLDAFQKSRDLNIHFLDCTDTEIEDDSTAALSDITKCRLESSRCLKKKLKTVLEEIGLEALVSIPVVHCPQAFGLVMKAAKRNNITGKTIPGWKLVYSGDTRPCSKLIDAARGATVLIHEATFENSMLEEAIAKNHSTTREAIQVGESAGAYRIILTHFSQRYPKIPVMDEVHMHKTCIGFDLMTINLADLHVLPKMMPYLKLLFRDEDTVSCKSHATVVRD